MRRSRQRVLIARFDWSDAGAVLYEGVEFASASIVHGVKLIAALPAADPIVAQRGQEAELVDAHNLIYSAPVVSSGPAEEILEVRVGGFPWRKVSHDPQQGEWRPVLVPVRGVCVQLGSPPLGAKVMFDTTEDDPPSHQEWRALNG